MLLTTQISVRDCIKFADVLPCNLCVINKRLTYYLTSLFYCPNPKTKRANKVSFLRYQIKKNHFQATRDHEKKS